MEMEEWGKFEGVWGGQRVQSQLVCVGGGEGVSAGP